MPWPPEAYEELKQIYREEFGKELSDEEELKPGTGKFKDTSVTYTDIAQINLNDLHRWLMKSRDIQWDYKNIIKHRGKLVKLK